MSVSKKKSKTQPPVQKEEKIQVNTGSAEWGNLPRWAMPVLLLFVAVLFRDVASFSITFIDDDRYILRNPYLFNFSFRGLAAIFTSFYEFNYHPLTTTVWLVICKIWGVNPMPYHLVNLAFHLLNTWLVYKLATALARQSYVGFMVAALFALHPLHVESVAWISELKGLLCATFYFASLLWYTRYVDGGYKRRRDIVVAFLFFVAALLSKSAAVTLPLAAMAIDVYCSRPWRKAIMEKLPFFALSVLFGWLAIMSQGEGGAFSDVADGYSMVNRIALFLSGLAFYIIKAVVPYHLTAIHYFPNQDGGALPMQFYLYPLVLPVVVWLAWRAREGKQSARFGLLFFLAVISVMLQLVTVGAAYASERYSYVSYFGLFFIAATWAARQAPALKPRIMAGFLGVLAVFSFLSASRLETWHDTDTIFTDIVTKNEGNRNNYLVYYHWGDAYQYQGNLQGAIAQYNEALKIEPGFNRGYLRRGEVHDVMGNFDAALADYDRVLKAEPDNAMAHNNRGWVYFEQGRDAEALGEFEKAIAINSKLPVAYNNRGWVKLQRKDTAAAMADFDRAIKADRAFAKAYYNKALVNVVRNKKGDAIKDYTALINVNNTDAQAHFYRGLMYRELGRELSARRDFEVAAALGNQDAAEALKAPKK